MEASGEAALTTLTAFIGAVIGIIGCAAAALTSDVLFSEVAACGAALCTTIWVTSLDRAVAFEDDAD